MRPPASTQVACSSSAPRAPLEETGRADASSVRYDPIAETFWLPQAAAALAQMEAGHTPEDTVATR